MYRFMFCVKNFGYCGTHFIVVLFFLVSHRYVMTWKLFSSLFHWVQIALTSSNHRHASTNSRAHTHTYAQIYAYIYFNCLTFTDAFCCVLCVGHESLMQLVNRYFFLLLFFLRSFNGQFFLFTSFIYFIFSTSFFSFSLLFTKLVFKCTALHRYINLAMITPKIWSINFCYFFSLLGSLIILSVWEIYVIRI